MRNLFFTLCLVVFLTSPFLDSYSHADARFTVIGNGTIKDNSSGLIWLQNANCFGSQGQAGAISRSNELANGQCGLSDGSKAGDWHLPTIDELRIFVDSGYRTNTLVEAGFLNVYAYYWSSTGDSYSNGFAWQVYMSDGSINYYPKYNFNYVWPVRSAPAGPSIVLETNNISDFGKVAPGDSVDMPLTLKNQGPSAVTLGILAVQNSSAFNIISDSCTGKQLSTSDKCSILVRFSPQAVQSYVGTVSIPLGASTDSVELKGTGWSGGAAAAYYTLYMTQGGAPNSSYLGSVNGDNDFAGLSEMAYRTSSEDSAIVSHALYPVEFYTQKSSDQTGFLTTRTDITDPDAADTRQPLILIHGWQGDSSVFSGFIDRDQKWLQNDAQLGESYWDNFIQYFNKTPELNQRYRLYVYHYPSYKHVSFNARLLSKLIPKVGYINNWLASGKKITILSHSMGGLVSRSLIEEHDGVIVKKGDGSTIAVSGIDMLDKLVTSATPHHGSPGSVYWWLAKQGFTSNLADFKKDLFSPGAQDLFWDNYDGIFDWNFQSSYNYSESGADVNRIDFNNSGRRSESAAFDSYYRTKLHLLDSRANDAYASSLNINDNQTTVYRYPNPWLSWMNARFRQNTAAYSSKYIFYGGYNDGNDNSLDNRLNDQYFSDLAADARIYEIGYINDWAVPLTSGFLDFSKESTGDLFSYNPTLFSDSGGKSALFPAWLIDHSMVKLSSNVNSIPSRALKDYHHDRMLNGAYFDTPADLQAHALPSGFTSDVAIQMYMEQSGVSYSNYLTEKNDPVLQADAKLLYEPLFNLFKTDLSAFYGGEVIVSPRAGVGGSLSPYSVQRVISGGHTSFDVLPDSGFIIDNVTGCGGSLIGSTYEIIDVTADCTVTATFKSACQQTIGNLFFKSSTCKTFTGYDEFYGDITIAHTTTPDNPVIKIFNGSLTLESAFKKVSMPLLNGIKPLNILGVYGIGNVPIIGVAFSFDVVDDDTLKVPTGNSQIAIEGIQKLTDLLFGFHYSLDSIKIGADSAKVTGKVVTGAIEETIQTDKKEPISLTGTVTFSQKDGLGLDAIELNAKNFALLGGAINLKDVGVSYSIAEEKFAIGGMVNIPYLMNEAGLGGGFTFLHRQFDGFSAAASGLNYPLGTSGFFFNDIKLTVEGLSDKPVKIDLKGSFSGGPKLREKFKTACFNDVSGNINFSGIFSSSGSAGLLCHDDWESMKNGVLTGIISQTYDHTKKSFTAEGSVAFPLDIIKSKASLFISQNDFYGTGTGAICPPLAGCFAEANQVLNKSGIGSSFRIKDQESAVFVEWGVVDSLSFPWGIPSIDPIEASKHIKIGNNLDVLTNLVKKPSQSAVLATSSKTLANFDTLTVPSGLGFAIIRVKWQTSGSTDVSLIAPDGTIITPAYASAHPDLVAYQSFGNDVWYALEPPTAGIWHVKIADPTQIGDHEISLNILNVKPIVAVTSPATKVTTSTTTSINYIATDPDSAPSIALYYDTKNKGGAGIKIVDSLPMPAGIGNYNWDVSEVPPGVYYIYSVIDDGKNTPVVAYSSGTVEVVNSSAPFTPVGFSASVSTDGIDFSWTEVADATGYHIYLTDDLSSEAYPTPIALASGTSSFTAKGLKSATTYRTTIAAFNSNNLESQRASNVIVGTGSRPVPVLALSANSIGFGTVISGTSGSKSITVTNNGTADLIISSALISGTNSTLLALNQALTLPLTIAPGQATTVTVSLTATNTGVINSLLYLVSNDPATPNKTIAISATITLQSYTVTPSTGLGGIINPSTPQMAISNSTLAFTISPAAGYHILSVAGCGGNLAGNIYSTGTITAACEVAASFAMNPIVINNAESSSAIPAVTLTLTYANAAQMQFLVDKAAAWTKLEAFVGTKSIKLPTGNGLKTVSVRFIDKQGKASPIYSASIFLDPLAPVGTISINNGSGTTDSTTLTINLTASDSGNGQMQMRFSEDGKSWLDDWTDFAPTTSYTLGTHPVAAVAPGLKKVYVQLRDAGRKVSKASFDTIIYTSQIPTGDNNQVTINTGATYTTSSAVSLVFTVTGGEQYVHLSNDGTSWGKWLPLTSATNWKLSNGDGVKTVYAQFSVDQQTASSTYRASIILDTIAPSGWLLINNGASVAGSATVNLTMGASDVNDVAKMCIKETSAACGDVEFENYATSKINYTFQNLIDGKKTLYVSYKDNAGKVSKPIKASIILDTTTPTGSILINGGKLTTTNSTVALKFTASKAVYMQLSMDGGATWGEWEAFVPTRSISLSPEKGPKTVMVKYKDFAEHESPEYSASITLL